LSAFFCGVILCFNHCYGIFLKKKVFRKEIMVLSKTCGLVFEIVSLKGF
jgi:hypothetical protein